MMNIERLPDELWLEIFSYISYLDLFRCFSNLNQRINSILHSKRIKLKLKNNQNYEKFKTLIENTREYITNFSIEYSNQNIDLSPFINLLSLHIVNATKKQLILIQSNYFKYLNQLHIVVCPPDYQLEDILFTDKQLKCLTTCWFPNLYLDFNGKKTYRPCFTLRSLRLNYCHINMFVKLLHFLPNLNSFESAFVSVSSSNEIVSHLLFQHVNLNRLKILLRDDVSLEDLKSILTYVPYVEQFYLNVNKPNICTDELYVFLLANSIQHLLSNMKICEIKVKLLSRNIKIKLDDLKTISPLFPQIRIKDSQTYIIALSDWYQNILSKNQILS